MTFSKRVFQGTLVMKRGDKYVRWSGRGRCVGVYQPARTIVMLTAAGRQVFNLPPGIVQTGPTEMRVK